MKNRKWVTSKWIDNLKRASLILLTVGAILSMAPGAQANKADEFSNRNIVGTWVLWGDAILGQDVVIVEPPFLAGTPLAVVGLVTFAKDGTCEGALDINFGGQTLVAEPIPDCKFTVNPNGFGVMTTTAGFGGELEFRFAIVNKNLMLAIRADPLVAALRFERQRPGH